MSNLAKPTLRGLLMSQTKKHFGIMLVTSFSVSILYKVFVADRRKRNYANFYKTYDPEKQLKIMNEAGLMQSYQPK